MSVPLYIQQGPNPTWWLSPAIWVTAQGDPSTGPKVLSPIVGKPYTVWVEIQNFYMEADTGGWNLFVCWGIPFTGTLPSVNIGQILNGAMTSAGPQGAPITVTIPGGTLTSPGIVTLPAATTWTPTLENGGHECLVAAVYDEQDIGGLPASILLDGDATWSQSYSVAQHNLGVVAISMMGGKSSNIPSRSGTPPTTIASSLSKRGRRRSARSPISSRACRAGGRSWRTRARSIASAFWRLTKLNRPSWRRRRRAWRE